MIENPFSKKPQKTPEASQKSPETHQIKKGDLIDLIEKLEEENKFKIKYVFPNVCIQLPDGNLAGVV
jgi:fatty acid-binding protein DegV